jgi:hypothetical protein
MKHTENPRLRPPLSFKGPGPYHINLVPLHHRPSSSVVLTGSAPSLSFASERSEPSKPSGI